MSTATHTWRFVLAVALAAALSSVASAQGAGEIAGVVVDEFGEPLAGQRLEMRRPPEQGPTRLVTTTDERGRFVYQRLAPGRYEVELRVEGRAVATSGPVELSDENMQVSGLTLVLPRPPPGALRVAAPPERPRMSASAFLEGGPVLSSFENLRDRLQPGQEIVVTDDTGRRTRGRVSSIADDRLMIAERAGFWPFLRGRGTEYPVDSITRVDMVDPVTKGFLIGSAVGAGLLLAIEWADRRYAETNPDALRGFTTVFLGVPLAIASIGIGTDLDLRFNEPVYLRSPQAPRVTLVPRLGPGRGGIFLHVSF